MEHKKTETVFSKKFAHRAWRIMKGLMAKHSPERKKIMVNFDKIRMYLTNFACLTILLQYVGFMATKTAHYDKSAEFIATLEPDDPTRKIGEAIIGPIKWTMIAMNIGRLGLMAASYKYLPITKFYFTYQVIFVALWNTLPDDYGRFQLSNIINLTYVYFSISFYFWWSSFISASLLLYVELFVRTHLY